MKCEEDHFDEDCIECEHDDIGGNWKRWIICLFLRHDWYYTYSWIGHCQRCNRGRTRKGLGLELFGDGFLVS